MILPEFNTIEAKQENIETLLNPLEVFIYYNEPPRPDDERFRKQLQAAIEFIIESEKQKSAYDIKGVMIEAAAQQRGNRI